MGFSFLTLLWTHTCLGWVGMVHWQGPGWLGRVCRLDMEQLQDTNSPFNYPFKRSFPYFNLPSVEFGAGFSFLTLLQSPRCLGWDRYGALARTRVCRIQAAAGYKQSLQASFKRSFSCSQCGIWGGILLLHSAMVAHMCLGRDRHGPG